MLKALNVLLLVAAAHGSAANDKFYFSSLLERFIKTTPPTKPTELMAMEPMTTKVEPTEASQRPAVTGSQDTSCALDDGSIGECVPFSLCLKNHTTANGVPVLEIQNSNGFCASDLLLCCHPRDIQKSQDPIVLQPRECILPPFPVDGTYEVLSEPKGTPGEKLKSFVLRVSCAQGYSMTQLGYDDSATQNVLCINGIWSQTITKCIRFCKLNANPSIRYMCSGTVCKQYVASGTVVEPVCNVYYSSENLSYMKCLAGRWNYVARCTPDCGRLTPFGLQLIIDGKPAKRGEIPWHVGIYRIITTEFEQICGGSLVSDKLVISAAHCFWSDVRKLLPAAGFAVAVGKLYRAWDDERDFDAQKSAIKEIKIPDLFAGAAAHFQEDIAVLILTRSIVINTYIRPVCLNFDNTFDTLQLQDGNYGKVAGWGLTSANGPSSEILNTVRMPFISAGVCVNTVPQSFRPFVTGDKFCAGYTNGTSLCRGDSGGGIAFPERQEGADRYYIRGIVSTAPVRGNQLCNDATYTTFTRIVKHEHLIKYAFVEVSNNCPPDMFQCEDNTCQDDESDCSKNW